MLLEIGTKKFEKYKMVQNLPYEEGIEEIWNLVLRSDFFASITKTIEVEELKNSLDSNSDEAIDDSKRKPKRLFFGGAVVALELFYPNLKELSKSESYGIQNGEFL